MIDGYARVSNDGESVDPPSAPAPRRRHGQSVPQSGKRGQDRSVKASPRPLSPRPRRRVDCDEARPLGAVDLLNTLAAITDKKAGFPP